MTVSKPRNRLINFRVSEDEFQAIMDATTAAAARSMSDHARNCVLGHNGTEDANKLERLEENMNRLHTKFEQLIEVLTEPIGATPLTPTSTQPEEVANGLAH